MKMNLNLWGERKMANEKYLIRADDVRRELLREDPKLAYILDRVRPVDAVEVVHGRWERCGGDLHSSGYAIYCSVCNKTHFVHYKYSLGGLYGCKELFEKPKYCPSCGAFMEVEE